MALQKDIRQDDGIITTYHRILFVNEFVNSHVSICVRSYVDAASREESTRDEYTYSRSITYEKDYQENMTVEQAYDYLKTLPEFEGAEDV